MKFTPVNLKPISANKTELPMEKSKRKPSILIFAADSDIRLLLRTILEFDKYEISEAETFEEAIILSEKRVPNLILIDAVRVISITFYEMRKMKKCGLFGNSPFIILSGHAQKEVRLMALAAGAADLLVKPFDYKLLESVIKVHLQNSV